MKETKKGSSGSIAIIDTQQLNKQGVYWAKPFHAQLHDYFPWTDGAWRYPGTHEFLVWDQIPKAAVVKVITFTRLFDSAEAHGVLKQGLALESLASNKALKPKLMPELKARNICLTTAIDALAALASVFGLSVASPYQNIEHIVSEVVLGWGLQLTQQRFEQWADHASSFVEALSRYTRSNGRLERKEKMKVAFLYGVRNALVGNWNALFGPQRQSHLRKMHKAAQNINLQDPPAIIRLALQLSVQRTLDSLNVYGAMQDGKYGAPATIQTTGTALPSPPSSTALKTSLDKFRYSSGKAAVQSNAQKTIKAIQDEVQWEDEDEVRYEDKDEDELRYQNEESDGEWRIVRFPVRAPARKRARA